jgi:hypothetical protein
MSDHQQIVDIRKFDVGNIKPDRIILIVGKRGTGKSTLLKDILSQLYLNFDAGCAMSPTPDSLEMFRQFIPDSCIFESYDPDKIQEIVEFLDNINKQGIHKKIFLILDDCMFDTKVLKSIEMRNIHMNGRHLHVTFINIVQYTMDIPKPLRAQIDYVFALREPQLDMRKNLYNNFFGIFPSFDDFGAAMDEFTKDNRCLVVDNTSKSNDIEGNVFWYKANFDPATENTWMKLGGRNYWKLHYMFYVEPKVERLPPNPIPALSRRRATTAAAGGGGVSAQPGKPASGKVVKRGKAAMTFVPRNIDGSVIIELPATSAAGKAPAARA